MKFNVGDIIKVKNRERFNKNVKIGFVGEIVSVYNFGGVDVITIDFFKKNLHSQVLTVSYFDDISLICSSKECSRSV